MARSQQPLRRKTRTREHVIGDLAVNAVERQVLLAGFTLELIHHDYGYDASIITFDDQGEPLPGWLYVQIKATEHPQRLQSDQSLAFRIERMDLVRWLREQVPVILCVYDVVLDVVYYCSIQVYFDAIPGFDLFATGETVTLHLPPSQQFLPSALKQLAGDLAQQQQRFREGRENHE